MAASMSKAVVGSIVSLIVYIISFTPFMAIFVLENSYNLAIRLFLVSATNSSAVLSTLTYKYL